MTHRGLAHARGETGKAAGDPGATRPHDIEGDPIALGGRARISRPTASRAVRTSPSRSTKIPDARRVPPGLSSARETAGQLDEDPGDQVGQDDVEGRFAARQAAHASPKPSRQAVPAGVGGRRLDCDRVGVHAHGRLRAQPQRGDRQDPGAAAEIQDAGPGQGSAIGEVLEGREAQSRRRMEPGPEGHPGVEGQHHVPRAAPMPPPGRPDDQPATDPLDREVRLPGLGPVRLVHQPRPELADRPQPEGLQVPERLRHDRRRALGRGPIAGRQVRPDDRRPGRIDPCPEALVGQLEAGLHGRPARGRAAEDLADGLDRLDVRLDGKLQPGALATAATDRAPDVAAGRRGAPRVASRAQPRPSFSRSPLPPDATDSPASSA